MIERHVYLKLADPGASEALATHCATALSAVPQTLGVTVGTPADAAARVWDLALTLRFATLADAHAAVASPEYARLFAESIDPAAVVQKAWNFRVG